MKKEGLIIMEIIGTIIGLIIVGEVLSNSLMDICDLIEKKF